MKKILVLYMVLLISLIGGIGLSNSSNTAEAQTYTTQKININKPRASRTIAPQIIVVEPDIVMAPESLEPEVIILEDGEIIEDPILWDNQPERITEIAPEIIQEIILEIIPEETIIIENSIADNGYVLGAEDKIKINVYGEKDLSSNYKLGADGTISMPLIGVVNIQGLTLHQAEEVIEAKLRDGYLIDPSVSIEVQESRPFYIMGEVRRPGSYNYINNMSVLQAVAISGGFTYRANRKKVEVVRGNKAPTKPIEINPEDIVRPGDLIFVKERFF